MPTYRVTDPASGKTVKLTGDSPPTEQELEEIFSSIGVTEQPKAQPGVPPTFEGEPGGVPEWGRENPNLYGAYGAGKALYEQALKPTAGALGMAGGAILGAPLGPAGMAAGAGLGHGMVQQGIGLAEEKLAGAPEQPLSERFKQAGEDVLTGATVEAGGQLASKGLQLAGKGIAAATKPIQKYFYESALKIPPSVPKALRDVAVEKGIQGQYVPSPKGLEKLQKDMDGVNKEIANLIDMGSRSGKTVKTGDVLNRLDDLRDFYKNAPNASDYLKEIDDFANSVKASHGNTLTLKKAQEMKKTIYRLNKKHYGELKNLSIESNKAIARGLKEEILKQEPDLGKLNAEDSAMINLDQVLERAVNRIRNYDVIRWGDTFMTLTGAVVGGTGGAIGAGLTKRLLEDAAIKSRIAFALSKAAKIKGAPITARVVAYKATEKEED